MKKGSYKLAGYKSSVFSQSQRQQFDISFFLFSQSNRLASMEANKHFKLLTLFNEEYVKMISSKEIPTKNQFLSENLKNRNKGRIDDKNKTDWFKKFKNLVSSSDHSTGDSNNKIKRIMVSTVQEEIEGPSTISVPEHSEYSDSKLKNNQNSKKKSWLTKDIFLDFCRDTSLHGLKYIGQTERHLSERIFWFVAFLSGLSLAVYMISDVWNKYNTSPIIVSFQSSETSVDEIPFPAITVCNMNKVLKSKADIYLEMASLDESTEASAEDAFYLEHVCSATKSFTTRFNFTNPLTTLNEQSDVNHVENERGLTKVNEFLRGAAQNCSDMIPLCLWQDGIFNCMELFRPIETEFGKCCTFNMVPQSLLYTLRNDERDDPDVISQWLNWDLTNDDLVLKDYVGDFPRRQMKAGKSFGLSFVLNPALNEYYCTTSDSTGFRMVAHLSIDVPHVTDFGISIRPKSEVFVNLRPEITMVDQSIFKFPIETRQCYRSGEFSLKYYKYYSPSNCADECIANATMEKCGCKRYFMPRDENETLCGGDLKGLQCAEDIKAIVSKFGVKNSCNLCLASCNEIDYQSTTTTTPLQDNIWMGSEINQNPWANENVSIVHVFFGMNSIYPRVRKELFGSTDLFANTGGLMGLCLGFSGLSLMEVVYFLTLRAWWSYRRKKNTKTKVSKKWKDIWTKLKQTRKAQSKEGSATKDDASLFNSAYHTIDNAELNSFLTRNIQQPAPVNDVEKDEFASSLFKLELSAKCKEMDKRNSFKDEIPPTYKNFLGEI